MNQEHQFFDIIEVSQEATTSEVLEALKRFRYQETLGLSLVAPFTNGEYSLQDEMSENILGALEAKNLLTPKMTKSLFNAVAALVDKGGEEYLVDTDPLIRQLANIKYNNKT